MRKKEVPKETVFRRKTILWLYQSWPEVPEVAEELVDLIHREHVRSLEEAPLDELDVN